VELPAWCSAVTGRRVWRWVCCPCAGRRRDRFQGGRGCARCL